MVRFRMLCVLIRSVSLPCQAPGIVVDSLTQREEYPNLVGDSLDLAVHIHWQERLSGFYLVGFGHLCLHRRFALQVSVLPTVEHTSD